MLIVKQGSCEYQFYSHWFGPTCNQTESAAEEANAFTTWPWELLTLCFCVLGEIAAMFEASDDLFSNSKELDNRVAELAQIAVGNVTVLVDQVEVKIIQINGLTFSRMDFSPNASDAVLESLEVRGDPQNSSFTIVLLSVPRHAPMPEISRSQSGLLNSVIELPNSFFISINVFNRRGFAKLQAVVSYSVGAPDLSSSLDKVFPRTAQSFSEKLVIVDWQYVCQFYDAESNKFSSFGCSFLKSSSDGEATCHCNHTTIFAVLLSVNAFVIPQDVKVSDSEMKVQVLVHLKSV